MFTAKSIFWGLIANFFLILAQFFVPIIRESVGGSKIFLLPFASFFLLGVALMVATRKGEARGWRKKFLMLTGASSAGFFVGVLLHNLVYGLFILLFGADFWDKVGPGGDEPFFFLFAIVVCPLGFLIGAGGSIMLFIKEKIESKRVQD